MDIPSFSLPEIEQGFLSCLMQYPKVAFQAAGTFLLTSEHFQTPRNRVLFDALSNFWRNGKPIDLILLTNELRELGILDSIGGAHYITEIWLMCYSEGVAPYYAGMIAEAHEKRLIAAVCGDIQKEAREPLTESKELIDSSIKRLTAIPVKPRQTRTLLEAVHEKLDRMERGEEAEGVIKTGISEIDRQSKLRRADMPLIVGHRKAGKSILALTIALNVAKQAIPVLIFSLEDHESKVIDRLFAGIARSEKPDMPLAANTAEIFASLPLHIKYDCLTLESIEAVTKELKERCDIGLVIVDYAQIVKVRDRRDTNREQKVAEVSRTLRLLAMELETPIIVLSQLNAEDQSRESRALEQDATACWWICLGSDDEEENNIRYIKIPWQRNGPSGIRFKVTFLGAIARVENYRPE
jgi:replicative DNA helicase